MYYGFGVYAALTRKFKVFGTVLLSLFFIFGQVFSISGAVFAQEEPAAEPTSETEVVVSAEAQAAAEADLVVSAEAQKELAVDLQTELNLEGYDPIVPTDGFVGTIVSPLRDLAWDVQEGAYDLFAADSTHAALVHDHANKELLAAAEVYADDPTRTGALVGFLDEYSQDLAEVEASIPAVKEENPELAKQLSANIAEVHLFEAPKVLSAMQDAILAADPEAATELVEIRKQVTASAGGAIVAAADSENEVVETLNILANKRQDTAFSGIVNAEVLATAKSQLADSLTEELGAAFDQVINVQLRTVEENLKTLAADDTVKADQFKNYVSQLPGHSLERMKVVDQFKSQIDLPPIFIEKCKEIQVKVAQAIGEKIKSVVKEEVRKAMSEAMLSVAHPGVEDFKVMQQMKDFVPDAEFQKLADENINSQIVRFRERFADDQKAQRVTGEFEQLVNKMKSGNFTPDPAHFKAMDALFQQLGPEQQTFIDQMNQESAKVMYDRMQNDVYFEERFATFNPADIEVFERFRDPSSFGAEFGPPPGFDFEAKFRDIERSQAQNFEKFLGFQNNPENVQAVRQHFDNFVPEDVRARFESQYNFNEDAFARHEELAGEKAHFFEQKFQEIQKQYEERFGSQPGAFPGQTPTPFPGGPGFGFPGAGVPGAGFGGFTPPPFFQGEGDQTDDGSVFPQPLYEFSCSAGTVKTAYGCEIPYEKVQFDPGSSCASSGGTWTGSYCRFEQTYQTPSYQTPTGNYPTPYGTDGKYLTPPVYQTPNHLYETPSYYTPSVYQTPYECCPAPGEPPRTGDGSYPTPFDYHTPGEPYFYPTPHTEGTYPTPTSYPTPSYVTPGYTYPTPTQYGTPADSSYITPQNYITPNYLTPTTDGSYPYPTPIYPTPSDSTYAYPTPSTYAYPTPSESYPTPTSYAYPTPTDSHTESYPYPTPSYAYPTPTESYPTPAYAYPTPEAYAYPTPAYAYPTPEYPYPTPPTSYYPYAPYDFRVAGATTRRNALTEFGLFDLLGLFGLSIWGYRRGRARAGK